MKRTQSVFTQCEKITSILSCDSEASASESQESIEIPYYVNRIALRTHFTDTYLNEMIEKELRYQRHVTDINLKVDKNVSKLPIQSGISTHLLGDVTNLQRFATNVSHICMIPIIRNELKSFNIVRECFEITLSSYSRWKLETNMLMLPSLVKYLNSMNIDSKDGESVEHFLKNFSQKYTFYKYNK